MILMSLVGKKKGAFAFFLQISVCLLRDLGLIIVCGLEFTSDCFIIILNFRFLVKHIHASSVGRTDNCNLVVAHVQYIGPDSMAAQYAYQVHILVL